MSMTLQEVVDMVSGIGLPYAYYQFPEDPQNPVSPPFLAFFYPNSRDLFADGANYASISALTIELYSDEKDFDLEARVENALTAKGLAYTKEETWLDSERMYVIVYHTEVFLKKE